MLILTEPSSTLTHILKKNIPNSKYIKNNDRTDSIGIISNKKLKKINSDTKNKEVGKPKNIIEFISMYINSLGYIKHTPETS